MSAVSLLFGGKASLVQFQFPETAIGNGTIDSNGNVTNPTTLAAIPIFTGVNLDVLAALSARFGLTFGFDTSGLTEFAQSGYSNPALILDGLYAANPTLNGVQVPMATFGGSIGLAVVAGVAGTDVSGTGDVSGVVNVGLANGGTEYLGNVLNLLSTNPLGLFNVDGRITAGLDFNVDVLGQNIFGISTPRLVLYPPPGQTSAANGLPTVTTWGTLAGADFETPDNWSPTFAATSDHTLTGTWDLFADSTIDIVSTIGPPRPTQPIDDYVVTFNGPLEADLYSLQLAAVSTLEIQSNTLLIDGSSLVTHIAGRIDVSTQPGTLLPTALYMSGVVNNTGTITLAGDPNGGAEGELGATGVLDLTGGGRITGLNENAAWTIGSAPNVHVGNLLRNDDNLIDGVGSITVTLENHGQVIADAPGRLLILANVTNTGLLAAAPPPNTLVQSTQGTLAILAGLGFSDSIDIRNQGGTISASGGGKVLIGSTSISGPGITVTIHGGTLAAPHEAGSTDGTIMLRNQVTLDGGVAGMTVAAPLTLQPMNDGSGALLTLTGLIQGATYGAGLGANGFTSNGSDIALYHATIRGGLLDGRVPAGSLSGIIQVEGSATLDGSAGQAGVGIGGTLHIGSGNTLALGGGIVPANFGGAIAMGNGTIVVGVTGNDSATLGPAPSGGQGTLVMDGTASRIVPRDTASVLTNSWLVSGTIGLISGGLNNTAAGTILAEGAFMGLNSGTVASSNQGLIAADTFGVMTIDSTLNNAGGTLSANGGALFLRSYSVTGGTLQTPNGGTIDLLFNETLSGVGTALTLAAGSHIVFDTDQTITGTIDNLTTLHLTGNSATPLTETLHVTGTARLTGGGALLLADAGGQGASATQVIAGGHIGDVLDNIDNTISGYGVFSGALGFVNEATGTVLASGGMLAINVGFANRGVATALSGATLALGASVTDTGATLLADGGTLLITGYLTGGTLAARNGGVILANGAYFDGRGEAVTIPGTVTVAAPASLPAAGHNTLTLRGVIANAGTLQVQSDVSQAGNSRGVLVSGIARLTGGGLLSLSDVTASGSVSAVSLLGGSGSDVLDNADNQIVGYGTIGAGQMSLTNEAAGVIEASGGEIFLHPGGAASHSANAGLIEAVGTTIDFTGTIANGGGTLAALADGAANAGLFLLDGADVVGGTLAGDAASRFRVTAAGAMLDGTAGALLLAAPSRLDVGYGATLTLAGTVTNSGSVTLLADTSHGLASRILVAGTARLAGGGLVTMSDTLTAGVAGAVISGSSSADLLDNVDNRISGIGRVGNATMSLRNESAGVIEAAGGTLVLRMGGDGATEVNQGTLDARSGTLDLFGTIANAGGTITALHGGGGSGLVLLDGLTVQGGLLASDTGDAASVLSTTTLGATLDGSANAVTLAAGGRLQVIPASTMTLRGAVVDQGNVVASGSYVLAGGLPTKTMRLLVSGAVSLTGSGTIALVDAGGSGSRFSQIVSGNSYADTLDTAAIIRGVGLLGNNATTLINRAGGTVSADGGTLYVSTGTVAIANTGLLTSAASGTLELRSSIANTGGTIAAAGVTMLDNITVTGGHFGAGAGRVLGSYATIDGSAAPVTVDAGGSVGLAYDTLQGNLFLTGEMVNHGTLFVQDSQLSVYAGQTMTVVGNVHLTGGGLVSLQDSNASQYGSSAEIFGYNPSYYTYTANPLANADNRFAGRGRIGNPDLAITNEAAGIISAEGGTLAVTTSSSNSLLTLGYVVNRGTMQALGGMLYLDGSIDNRGGTIQALNDGAGHVGLVTLHNALIQGGLLQSDPSDPASYILSDNYGGTLDGTAQAVVLGTGTPLRMAPSSALTLTGAIVNHGTLLVQATSGYYANVTIEGTVALSGGGRVAMSDLSGSLYDRIFGSSGADLIDNIDNTIIGLGDLGFGRTSIRNEAGGSIIAQGGVLLFDPTGPGTTVSNQGLVEALGGTLDLRANLLNAGGVIAARNDGAGHSGIVLLTGSDIQGGVLAGDATDAASVIFAGSSFSTLDGTTSPLTLDTTSHFEIDSGRSIELLGSIKAGGTIALSGNSNYFYSPAQIIARGNVILSGGGRVVLNDITGTGGRYSQVITGVSTADTLDNAGVTIIGVGEIGNNTMSFVNEAAGVVNATGLLILATGSSTAINRGLLTASTTSGFLDITSRVDNTGGTIGGGGGTVLVDNNGTVAGGTLAGVVDGYYGTLDGISSAITIAAGATVGISATVPNTYSKPFYLAGSFINHGTLLVQGSDSGVGIPANLTVVGTVSLSGGGEMLLQGIGSHDLGTGNKVWSNGAGSVLDNVDNLITGFGTLGAGALPVIDESKGIIRAQGGRLELPGAVSGTGLLEIADHATLALDAAVGSGLTINFRPDGGHETLSLGRTLTAGTTIENFAATDVISFPGVFGTITSSFVGNTVTLTSAGSTIATFTLAGNAGAQHISAVSSGGTVTLGTTVPCFAAGTRILTLRGEIAVESLAEGDRVPVLVGHGHRAIRWIGHRKVALAGHPRPQDVQPVRVMPDAFGPGMPRSDLRLSPDHAVFVAGALVPIRYLINGASIVQEDVESVTYYHVELAGSAGTAVHDVMLAQGLPAESFLDTGNRGAFANAEGSVMAHPDFALRQWGANACAPLLVDGDRLVAIRRRLHALVLDGGQAIVADPAPYLRVDGRVVWPERWSGTEARFNLPRGARSVRLVSRVFRPGDLDPLNADLRRLGMAVSSLIVDGVAIDLRDGRLADGWHHAETGWRWTDGAAAIPCGGCRRVDVAIAPLGHYWSAAPSHRRWMLPVAARA